MRRRRRFLSGASTPGHGDGAAELDVALGQINQVLARVVEGDLDARVVLLEGPEAARHTADRINSTLDLLEAYTRETQACLRASAEGRFHRVVLLRGLPGQFGDGARSINAARAAMLAHDEQLTRRDAERSRLGVDVAGISERLASAASGLGDATRTLSLTTQQAVTEAGQALSTMDSLQKASAQIQSAVQMIVEVADQTRLLALNATIEAARAGDAGKGFAVVAGEVKNLASETTASSEKITVQVHAAQEAARAAAASITAITSAIREIDAQIGEVRARVDGADGLEPLAARLSAQVDRLAADSTGQVG